MLNSEADFNDLSENYVTEMFKGFMSIDELRDNYAVLEHAMLLEEQIFLYTSVKLGQSSTDFWKTSQAVTAYKEYCDKVVRGIHGKQLDWRKLFDKSDSRNLMIQLWTDNQGVGARAFQPKAKAAPIPRHVPAPKPKPSQAKPKAAKPTKKGGKKEGDHPLWWKVGLKQIEENAQIQPPVLAQDQNPAPAPAPAPYFSSFQSMTKMSSVPETSMTVAAASYELKPMQIQKEEREQGEVEEVEETVDMSVLIPVEGDDTNSNFSVGGMGFGFGSLGGEQLGKQSLSPPTSTGPETGASDWSLAQTATVQAQSQQHDWSKGKGGNTEEAELQSRLRAEQQSRRDEDRKVALLQASEASEASVMKERNKTENDVQRERERQRKERDTALALGPSVSFGMMDLDEF